MALVLKTRDGNIRRFESCPFRQLHSAKKLRLNRWGFALRERILSFPPKVWYNIDMARKIVMKPVAKQNRNNNHKHSDKRKHPRLKNGR